MPEEEVTEAATAAGTGPTPPRPPAPLRPGARVGRYVIEERLGAGAMGAVYEAHDPELVRSVALKLLHVEAEDPQRLRDEGRALASVSHPNVVTVFDVGSHQGRMFVAMELVSGPTLRRWLEKRERSRDEILAMCIAVGRGIEAVHAAGLVHRDVKPDNVLVAEQPRVVDFGLAELVTGGAHSSAGTPVYMAPERFDGAVADPRTDQFSFCVLTYEALVGHRPFAGRTAGALVAAMEDAPKEPPRKRIPPRLWAALRRGLSPEPAERFEDMAALLAALEDAARGRGRLGVAVALGAVTLGGAVFLLRESGEDPCAASELGWADAGQARVEAALLRDGDDDAHAAWPHVEAGLTAYAEAWADAQRDACGQRDAYFDRRILCLSRRRAAFDSLVDVLAAADATTARHSISAVTSLPSVEACTDLAALQAGVPPPQSEAERRALGEADARVAVAQTAYRLGRYADAVALAREAIAMAEGAGALHAQAEAELTLARSLQHGHEGAEAARRYRRSAMLATVARDDALTAEAWTSLAVMQAEIGPIDDAKLSLAAAAAAVERAGSIDTPGVETARALIARSEGRTEAAIVSLERAVELRRAAGGRGLAEALLNLANVELEEEVGQPAVHIEAAVEIFTRELGRAHPSTAGALNSLGVTLLRAEDPRALEVLQEALARREAALGADHEYLAGTYANVARALQQHGRYQEALAATDRAAEIARRDEAVILGARIELVATDLLLELERPEEALARTEAAIGALTVALGPRHQLVASAYADRAAAQTALGRLVDAAESWRSVCTIQAVAFGPTTAAGCRLEFARALRAAGRSDEAKAEARGALSAVAEGHDVAKLRTDIEAFLAEP